jgi:hypothetical protein
MKNFLKKQLFIFNKCKYMAKVNLVTIKLDHGGRRYLPIKREVQVESVPNVEKIDTVEPETFVEETPKKKVKKTDDPINE